MRISKLNNNNNNHRRPTPAMRLACHALLALAHEIVY